MHIDQSFAAYDEQVANTLVEVGPENNLPSSPLKNETVPGVVFSMRYADDAGYVWNTIAQGKDMAAFHLGRTANSFIAYPSLSGNATYSPKYLQPVQLDCYDMSAEGRRRLSGFISQHRVKVIVFMSALPTTVDLVFFHRLRVCTLNTENDSFDHTQRDNLLKKSIKYILRRVLKRQLHDLHLANARSQEKFLARYALIPSSRLALLTDGVDCNRFKPGDRQLAQSVTGMDADTFWIICVAQARPEKRLDLIIKAAKEVITQRSDSKIGFMYVGDGDGSLTKDLKELVKKLDLQERFHFAGRQDDLVPYYRSADIMIHAAERESFGLAVVEAMACGLPVIASAAAGPLETIVKGKTGALVEVQDFTGFVSAILMYVDNRDLKTSHGKNAAAHAAANYSLDRYGSQLAKYILPFIHSYLK